VRDQRAFDRSFFLQDVGEKIKKPLVSQIKVSDKDHRKGIG
jgi:hypothetical protein